MLDITVLMNTDFLFQTSEQVNLVYILALVCCGPYAAL